MPLHGDKWDKDEDSSSRSGQKGQHFLKLKYHVNVTFLYYLKEV